MRCSDPEIEATLSGALGQPVTLAREAAVSHFDAGPVHLVTLSDIAWLRHRDWFGKAVAAGSERLHILELTERCAMVTFAQEELEQAPDVLRTITQERDLLFGFDAEVVTPDAVDSGNLLALVDDWRGFSRVL